MVVLVFGSILVFINVGSYNVGSLFKAYSVINVFVLGVVLVSLNVTSPVKIGFALVAYVLAAVDDNK